MEQSFENQEQCDFCHNLLSYFPIYMYRDSNICGRCYLDYYPNGELYQNSLYEKAVALQYFPCRYQAQGCCRKSLPVDMAKHELKCSFRLMNCPLCLGSRWTGNLSDLKEHCVKVHQDLMLEQRQDFQLTISFRRNTYDNFFIYNDKLFFVSWNFFFQKYSFNCLIKAYRGELDNTNYSFKLKLKSETKTYSTAFDVDDLTEILYDGLYDKNSESLSDTFILTAFLAIKEASDEVNRDFKTKKQSDLLSLLKCYSCFSYVLPPIYTCKNGKIYCESCHENYFDNFDVSLNTILSNVTSLIPYPCNKQELGCKFIGLPALVTDHQKICKFRTVKCIFSTWFKQCLWEDECRKLESHIDEEHDFEMNVMNSTFNISYDTSIYTDVIKFNKTFFKIIYFAHDNYLLWFVMKIDGMFGNFKYELELIDINKTQDCLVIRKSCSDFIPNISWKIISCHQNVAKVRKDQVNKFKESEGEAYIQFTINILLDD